MPSIYGQLNQDITFQRGDLVDQWTVTFENKETDERGIVLVRFAPRFWGDIIEFEVLLNTVPIDDFQGKDVTVNWQFFNGFDPKGQFWTDSNALGMVKREI